MSKVALQLNLNESCDASFVLALTTLLPRIRRDRVDRVFVATEWPDLLAHNPFCEGVLPGFAPRPDAFVFDLPSPTVLVEQCKTFSPAYFWAARVANMMAQSDLLDLSAPVPATPKLYITNRERELNLLRGNVGGKAYWIMSAPAVREDLRKFDLRMFRSVATQLTYSASFPLVVQAGRTLDTDFQFELRSGTASIVSRANTRQTVIIANNADGVICRPGPYEMLAAALGKPCVLMLGQWSGDIPYFDPSTLPALFSWVDTDFEPLRPRFWQCPDAGCSFTRMAQCPHNARCVDDPSLSAVIADAARDIYREDLEDVDEDNEEVSTEDLRRTRIRRVQRQRREGAGTGGRGMDKRPHGG